MNSDQNSKDTKLEADVVVIGGGGAGLTAAVSAAEKWAKVILLEKQALGGNTALAHGLFAAESEAQKAMRIIAPRDELFKMAMQYNHWKTNPRIIRTFINKSADTIMWLMGKGIFFDHIISWCPGQYPPVLHRAGKMGTGVKIIKALSEDLEKLGGQILTHCPVKKILLGEQGEVTGVLAEQDGAELHIRAKSVIIATGGYAGNQELLKKYYPSYNETMVNNGLPLKGDGLLMAMEIGAATEGLGVLMLHPPVFPGKMSISIFTKQSRSVWVNKRGERFTDETMIYRIPECANAVDRQVRDQKEKCIYMLFDNQIKAISIEENEQSKLVMGTGPWSDINANNVEEDLKSEVGKGHVKIADSWEEIAEWMGAPPENLKATIEEYNTSCDHGYDEVFIKDRQYLQALRNPPYYALKCNHCLMTTIGGIKINHHMEVMNGQEKAIPGLYAVGDTTGGWQTDTYNMTIGGSALGFAINSGRIAGENAAVFTLGK